jgi:FKBP-type peptidyl-prolyl cis-trans isomerase
MKQLNFLVFLGALWLVGCGSSTEEKTEKNDGFRTDESGFKVNVHKKGNGKSPQVGDLIQLVWKQSYQDSMMRNSNEELTIQMTNPEFHGDLFEALKGLKEGDSATILVPVDSLLKSEKYRNADLSKIFKPKTFIKNEVVIHRIYNEDQLLADTMKVRHSDVAMDPQGFYLIYLKKGNGPFAKAGQKIKVDHQGSMLDGTLFATTDAIKAKDGGIFNPSMEYGPIELEVGNKNYPPGWNRVFPLLRKGDHVQVYFPSYMMFGPKGEPYYGVPPFTSVIYEFNVLDLK